jgi:predicted enzyme related to lactoylglutathione lyase
MPSPTHGKICYVEIPATDVAQSVAFYQRVFGWKTRARGDGATAFDDATGQVSGSWVTGRPAASAAALIVYVMVDDAAATCAAIVAAGGEIVVPVDPAEPVIFAHFRDPAGNVLGIYQEPSR